MDIDKFLKEGPELLDRLIKEAKGRFDITTKPIKIRDLEGRRVTVATDIRQGTIAFFDFWAPETVQMNWDDLVEWIQRRP